MARSRPSDRAPNLEAPGNLPKPILRKLNALVRRVRRIQIIRGGLATLAAAALAVISIVAIGTVFTILSARVHAALSAIGLVAVGITAYRTLYLPLRKELSLTHIARVIETRNPELHERISTAIGLLNPDDPAAVRGSEQLLSKVVDSAIDDARLVRPEREFTNRTSRRYLVTLAAAATMILGGVLLFPKLSTRLLTRAVAPFSKVGNAFADRLDVEPGDYRVAAGDPLTIRVTIRDAGAQGAEIRRTDPGSAELVESMALIGRDQRADSSQFAITFPAVHQNFHYRIRSGRAVSASFGVGVAARPEIRRVETSYQFPAYTKLEPVSVNDLTQSIEAVTGTSVKIRAHFDRPLDSAVFKIDGNPLPATDDRCEQPHNPRSSWDFEMAAGTDGYWKIDLIDTESVSGRSVENTIRTIPDRVPSIRLLGSQRSFRVRPDERLTFRYEVDEDFGIRSAMLVVGALEREFAQELPILTSPETYAGEAVLKLDKLALTDAQTFQIYLSVGDVRPESQVARAGPITVTVDVGADSLSQQLVSAQRASMQASLETAIGKLQGAKDVAGPIAQHLLMPEIIPQGTLQALAKIRELAGEAESLVLTSAADASAPSGLFKALAPALVAAAADHIAPARQAAEEIPLTDEKVTRVHRAHRIVNELDEGIADLNVVIRELKQQTARARLLAEMSDLGEKHRTLGEELLAAKDPGERERLRRLQAGLAEAMGGLATDSQKSVADQLQDVRQIASKLAGAATGLAGKQSELAAWLDRAEDPSLREDGKNEVIRRLETEQREIGERLAATHQTAKTESEEPALIEELSTSSSVAKSAADSLSNARFTDAASTATGNAQSLGQLVHGATHASLRESLEHLAAWQDGLARQIDAIARDRLDEALAARQDFLADRATKLARNADAFRQQAESLADPSALQQVQQASSHAEQAARSARQASSQLGGETSGGAFEFARLPGRIPAAQNRNPGAPPAPIQAGVGDSPSGSIVGPPPGENVIDGVDESPFSAGQVSANTVLPPALENLSTDLGGGELPPGADKPAGELFPATGHRAATSGQDSIVSAARQPAMQAQHGLADAAYSLSNAAGSLAQQANSSSAQAQPQLNQQMLEAARKAAQLAIERNPVAAAKIAEAIAKGLSQQALEEIPVPDLDDWQDIQGSVRSGLAATSRNSGRDEYRDLVKSYFKEIARRSNQLPEIKQ